MILFPRVLSIVRVFPLLFCLTFLLGLLALPVQAQTGPIDPDFYDYDSHAPFPVTATPYGSDGEVTITRLTYPSTVVTPFSIDNQITAYLFLPPGPGPHPAVVVLHEWLPDSLNLSFQLSKAIAHQNIAVLAMVMPFSLNRRPHPGAPEAELISPNIPQLIDHSRQGILDVRRSLDYLQKRPDIDPDRLGIAGISLGGIFAPLAAGVDPRIKDLLVVIGGADVADILWDGFKTRGMHAQLLREGWTYPSIKRALAPVESTNWIHDFNPQNALLIDGRYDVFVQPKQAKRLAQALGGARIIWINAGHLGPTFSHGRVAEVGAEWLHSRFFPTATSLRLPDTINTPTFKVGLIFGGAEGFGPAGAYQVIDFDRAGRYSADVQLTLKGLEGALSARLDDTTELGLEFPFMQGRIRPRPFLFWHFVL